MSDRDFHAKDGKWIMVSHEFLAAIAKQNLSNAETRILYCVMRYAWGFGESRAELTRSSILKYTGLNDAAEWKANKKLRQRNIIKTFPQEGKKAKVYKINSKTSTWKNLPAGSILPTGRKKPSHRKRHLLKKNNKENNIYSAACEIIDALNDISGKTFKHSESSLQPIIARLKEGFSRDECLKVLQNKWFDPDLKMKYFRPQTLFRKSYFESYLNMNGNKKKPADTKQAAKLEKWQRRYRERYTTE